MVAQPRITRSVGVLAGRECKFFGFRRGDSSRFFWKWTHGVRKPVHVHGEQRRELPHSCQSLRADRKAVLFSVLVRCCDLCRFTQYTLRADPHYLCSACTRRLERLYSYPCLL